MLLSNNFLSSLFLFFLCLLCFFFVICCLCFVFCFFFHFGKCIESLSHYKNDFVLFGGDFNWLGPTKTRENDGEMKLADNWQDCWLKLHPNDKGFTYDGISNPMLINYYRNRLDRILIKQNDINKNEKWTLSSIEMIGKNQIGNLTYQQKCHDRKNGQMIKTLPVLPSDHYGLCAKFIVPN